MAKKKSRRTLRLFFGVLFLCAAFSNGEGGVEGTIGCLVIGLALLSPEIISIAIALAKSKRRQEPQVKRHQASAEPESRPVEEQPQPKVSQVPVGKKYRHASVIKGEERMVTHSAETRRLKGRSLLTFPNEYVVFDLETTGLDPKNDSIIEIAAIKVQNDAVVDTFETLVNPEKPISRFISNLTGITDEMVAGAPPLAEVLPAFLQFVGNFVVVGHNVNFDVNFIYDACCRMDCASFTNDYVDTLRLSRLLCPEAAHHRLEDLVERYGLEEREAHRAMSDVLTTNDCLMFLKQDEDAVRICCRGYNHSRVDAREIHARKEFCCDNPYIRGKTFVFTGTLSGMTRQEAMQTVADNGGLSANGVSKKVDYLVVGNPEYVTAIHGGKSTKQKRAEELRLAGDDIQVISENVFLDMIGFHDEPKEGCDCD